MKEVVHMMPILSNLSFLVIEDDEPKMRAILSLLAEIGVDPEGIFCARSVASALEVISDCEIGFAIVDMSLPAFDFARDVSGGGQPQGTGGRDILRFLEDEQPNARAVVLTQYQEFDLGRAFSSPQKLEQMVQQMKNDFSSLLLGVISYSGQRGKWRDELRDIIVSLGVV